MEVIANPLYSRPIDVHRWSDHPEVKDLVGTIWETYLPEELTRKKKTGPKACPFNYLYWAFLIHNQAHLDKNPRMAMPYRTLAKWSSEKKRNYLNEAGTFLESLTNSHSSLGRTHEE